MKDSTPSKEEETPKKPSCPFCQGEIIFPEFKEGGHPEPLNVRNVENIFHLLENFIPLLLDLDLIFIMTLIILVLDIIEEECHLQNVKTAIQFIHH